jgi:nucleotide-binding universal stress UspA family protein
MLIVCGTDLSAHSSEAVEAAAALARRAPASLCLVHVLEPTGEGLDAAVAAAAEQELEAAAGRVRARVGVQVHHELLHGSVSGALVAFASSKAARLLVISSKGHGGSPLFRVGGTSERVAQLTETPLLVVRDAAPFEAWAQESRPLRILVGVDFSASSDPAIAWVKDLRAAAPCDLVIGHVYYPLDAAFRYGLPPRGGLIERDPDVERLLLRDLAKRVGDLGGAGQVSFRTLVGLGRLGDHLLELAGRERADLIVVGTHRKRGLARLSSVSSVALHFGHASVACIPSALPEEPATELLRVGRVLVCTDLSAFANRAVPYGYAVLGDREGEVVLLHVLPAKSAEDSQAERAAVAQLLALVPDAVRGGRVATRTEIAYGEDVAGVVCQTAERVGADVISLASHGRSGVARTLLGSVAEAVLRKSRLPVLVVRPLPA